MEVLVWLVLKTVSADLALEVDRVLVDAARALGSVLTVVAVSSTSHRTSFEVPDKKRTAAIRRRRRDA